MLIAKSDLLRTTILRSVGADVGVEVDNSTKRPGLEAWFVPWRKQDGPIFKIKPAGLNRHRVSMNFGRSSGLCLRRISTRSEEQTDLAQALLQSLGEKVTVESVEVPTEISSRLRWKAQIKGLDSQHADESLIATTKTLMVPMIAAMAELIGFEEVQLEEPEEEGSVSKVLVTKRERSVRNRLLALQIHGYSCGTCGLRPTEVFGEALGGILEVHHIEPVSELGKPRAYNPSTDLIPLCPNCHRMIHKINPPYTPEQLREQLEVKSV